MSSFHEQMEMVRQRRLDREKQQAKSVLENIKPESTNGTTSKTPIVNTGTSPTPSEKVTRFNIKQTKPAKVKAPSLGELQSAWCDLLAQEMTLSKCDRVRATSIVAKKNPKLKAEMIEAANRERVRRRR